jgi:hypothetical protein
LTPTPAGGSSGYYSAGQPPRRFSVARSPAKSVDRSRLRRGHIKQTSYGRPEMILPSLNHRDCIIENCRICHAPLASPPRISGRRFSRVDLLCGRDS